MLKVVLLGLKLALAVIVPRFMHICRLIFPFFYESFVHHSLEVWEIQRAELATEGVIESSEEAAYLPFFSGHIVGRVPSQIVEFIQELAY